MKTVLKLALLVLFPVMLTAQEIIWEDVSSNYEFPVGLKLFHGTRSGNNSFFAYYYEVDLAVPEIAIRPYLVANPMQVDDFSASVGAYGAVNGGFFAGTTSVSSVVYPNEVLARNVTSLSRDGKAYPVIRSLFALNADRTLSTEWVYHHTLSFDDIYTYPTPLAYTNNDPDPLPVPTKEEGTQYENVAYGLGGGPMLVKDGQISFTWNEEIFWGSGVDQGVDRPRTAVGYTTTNKAIIFITNSMKIEDLPQAMLDLDCYGAINLDGGGSTAMAAGGESIYDQSRPVPTILAIVHTDSLNIPQEPTFEKIIDTSDEGVTSAGSWFATANDGYWETPSMLHGLATDNEFYDFPLNLPTAGEYEIYAWWVAANNRSADTPFYITHAEGTTEVRMNQTIGGSLWNKVGTFQFDGQQGEAVRITAAGTTNQYVVADAIRVISYDGAQQINQIATIQDVDDISVPFGTSSSNALALLATQTTITDTDGMQHNVDLSWTSETYDGQIAATYPATATFTLPNGVEQTEPPTALEVYASITVEQDDTSINESALPLIHLFPNPGQGIYTMNLRNPIEGSIEIISLEGKILHSQSTGSEKSNHLNLSHLTKGIYLLRLTSPTVNDYVKLVVE